jgi:hypothetical protein
VLPVKQQIVASYWSQGKGRLLVELRRPNRVLGLPSLKSGARYSIKRIGDIGEPWGSLHWISIRGPIESSSRIQTVRPVAKEAT